MSNGYLPPQGYNTKSFSARLATFVCLKPYWALSIMMFLGILTLPGLIYFHEKHDVRIWFKEDDPKVQTLDTFERRFGNDENIVIIMGVKSGGDLFQQKYINILREITEKAWRIPEVIRVDSLVNYNVTSAQGDDIEVGAFLSEDVDLTPEYLAAKKSEALSHKVIPNYFISTDAKSAMIFARLATVLDDTPDYKKIIKNAKEIMDEYSKDPNLEFHLVGEAVVNDAFRSVSNEDQAFLIPALFTVMIILLLLTFRSVKATLLPLGIMLFSVGMTLGVCFLLGWHYNTILAVLPGVLTAVSIADDVHVVVSYLQFYSMGYDKKTAVWKALHKNAIPTVITTIGTLIGFWSLLVTDLMPIREMGFLAGLGTVFAWFATYFFLGPLMVLMHIKVPKTFHTQKNDRSLSPLAVKSVELIDRYKGTILIFFTTLTVISFILGFFVEINSNPYEYFAPDTPIKQANDYVKEHFGSNAGPEIMIETGKSDGIKDSKFLAQVEQFKNWLDSRDYVTKTIDIVDIIKEVNKNLNEGDEKYYVIPEDKNVVAENLLFYSMGLPQGMDLNNRMTLDNDVMRMSILWSIFDTRGILAHVKILEDKMDELNLTGIVTGKIYLFQRMIDYVVVTFVSSITMAMLLIALLMSVLFRSIKIGLLSMVPNIIPLIFGAAFMAIFGIDLNIGSVIVASVSLGISVDNTIHFLSHYYRHIKEGLDKKTAIEHIFTFTGTALIITTVILVVGFGLFIFGDFIPNVNFGMISAFVLATSLIIDLIFLPALILWLDEIKGEIKGGPKKEI